MPTTYDLIVEVGALVADIMGAGGEVTPEQEIRLAGLLGDGEISHKIEALHAVVRRLKGESEILKGEEKRISARRRSAEKQAARLTDMAGELLRAHEGLTGDHKIKTAAGSAWLQSTVSLEIADTAIIPPHFYQPYTRIDKTAIKLAIEGGQTLEGCSLQETRSIRWR